MKTPVCAETIGGINQNKASSCKTQEFTMLLDKKSLITAVACLVPAGTALSGYKTVNSSFSDYSLRYKSWDADDTTLCNGGSKHHTGWADLDNRHLFFCKCSHTWSECRADMTKPPRRCVLCSSGIRWPTSPCCAT